MKRTTLKALPLAVLCCVLIASAQTQAQLKQQVLSSEEHRGAVEAVIWGMPAVNF